jgi:hypothetical protein
MILLFPSIIFSYGLFVAFIDLIGRHLRETKQDDQDLPTRLNFHRQEGKNACQPRTGLGDKSFGQLGFKRPNKSCSFQDKIAFAGKEEVGLTYSSLACDNLTFHRDEKKRRGDRRLTPHPTSANFLQQMRRQNYGRSDSTDLPFRLKLSLMKHRMETRRDRRRDIRLPVYHSKTIEIEIGAKLKELRLQAGMSQDKFGTAMGVSHTQVQKYEQGKNRIAVFNSRGNL